MLINDATLEFSIRCDEAWSKLLQEIILHYQTQFRRMDFTALIQIALDCL